ncbi:MAG TPA: hypothetical protein VNU92_11720 [Edaphobacter sp.]|nr:hypothetical protein [Edaphobacter sp.]
MSDHNDAQDYTANGPTDVGFRTGGDGTGITKGVAATGNEIGVHGTGLGVEGTSTEVIGVFGDSIVGIGVKGVSISQQGVLGISDTEDGVSGLSGSGTGVSGESKSGVGVQGSSSGNDGIVGTSSADRKSGVFGDHTDTTRETFGVSGRSQSPLGAGISGFSDVGYGGYFRGARAPLRLQPAATIGPPRTGTHQAGEFFVDANGDLFYCRSGEPRSGEWFHIVLGLPVDP